MLIVQESTEPSSENSEMATLMLTKLQWMVVHIAIADVGELSRFPVISLFVLHLASAIGIKPKWKANAPLANPELEALRQYACLCRLFDTSALNLVPTLLAAGIGQENLSSLARFVQKISRRY